MRKTLILIFTLLLLLSPAVGVLAVQPKIVDGAWLLSESEEAALEQKAQQIADTYQMDVVIVTVDSIGYQSIESYADDYYDDNGYGIGSDYSGVLLLLSMEYREWAISTCGDAIYALTDYGIESLFYEMAGYLSNDQYYLAFDAYLNALPEYFEAYRSGNPIDGYHGDYNGPGSYEPGTQEDIYYYPERNEPGFFSVLFTSLLIGTAVGGIALLIMRGQMKTVRRQSGAGSYISQNSAEITLHQDIFLYSNVTRTARPQNNNHHGGGSSVHRGGGGRRHGGGHGRF